MQKGSLGSGVNRLTYILGFKSQSKRKQEKKDNRQTTHTHETKKKIMCWGKENRLTGLCSNDEFKVLLTSHIQATEEIKSRLLPKFKF